MSMLYSRNTKCIVPIQTTVPDVQPFHRPQSTMRDFTIVVDTIFTLTARRVSLIFCLELRKEATARSSTTEISCCKEHPPRVLHRTETLRTAAFFDQTQALKPYTKGPVCVYEHGLVCSQRHCQVLLQNVTMQTSSAAFTISTIPTAQIHYLAKQGRPWSSPSP